MGWQKYVSYLGALSVALSVELVTFSLATLQLRAQSVQVSVNFPPADKRGAPDRTAGAGQRRRKCTKGTTPLTAVTPSNNVLTTVVANPTLFWYVPQTEAKSAEFVIVDNQGDEVYLTTLILNGIPGVAKLSLPETVALKTGKDYLWQFALICNPADRRQDEFVRGVIERTELSSEQKTKLAQFSDPIKQAEVYADARIWQETLTILAQLHHDKPHDSSVTNAWKELLTSVQLEAIVTEPLVECCRAGN